MQLYKHSGTKMIVNLPKNILLRAAKRSERLKVHENMKEMIIESKLTLNVNCEVPSKL